MPERLYARRSLPVRRLVSGPSWAVLQSLALAGVLAGCGNARTPVPDLRQPAAPQGLRPLRLPRLGLSLQVPVNWTLTSSRGQLQATISSGDALVALWRYPRTDPPPADPAALAALRRSLVAVSRRRDPALVLVGTRTMKVSGRPAVEIDARERIRGHLRRVRSVHVFAAGAELVLDAYAPPGVFHRVDHQVFSPMKRSLRIVA